MSDTNKRIIICVECNKKSRTDMAYIDKALKRLYKIGNDETLRYVYLDSKTKYNDDGIEIKINKEISKSDKYVVVFCLDTDDALINSETREFNQKIEEFCKQKGYKLVWFCEDIEEVFLHKKVNQSQKIATAKKFGSESGIGLATVESLSTNHMNKTKSNFMLVFNEIFERS